MTPLLRACLALSLITAISTAHADNPSPAPHLDARFAAPLADYSLVKVVRPYWEQSPSNPTPYRVDINLPTLAAQESWAAERGATAAIAWIDDGAVVAQVEIDPFNLDQPADPLPINLPNASARHGYPVVWFTLDGAPLPKPDIRPWDGWFFDNASPDLPAALEHLDPNQANALHYLAINGKTEPAKLILQAKPSLAISEQRAGPLDLASATARLDLCQILLAAPSPLADQPMARTGAAFGVARLGHVEIARFLFSGKNDSELERWAASYSLDVAIEHHHTEIAEHLLEQGVKTSFSQQGLDITARTCLKNGFPDTALWLVQRKQVKPTTPIHGRSLLSAATPYADQPLLDRLKSARIPIDPASISAALEAGNIEALNWLSQNGARRLIAPNRARFMAGALRASSITAVRWLVAMGASLNEPLESGSYPIMDALMASDSAIPRVYDPNDTSDPDFARRLRAEGARIPVPSPAAARFAQSLVFYNAYDSVLMLVEDGWQPTTLLPNGLTLAQAAHLHGSKNVLAALAKTKWPPSALEPLPSANLPNSNPISIPLNPLDSIGVDPYETSVRLAIDTKGAPIETILDIEQIPVALDAIRQSIAQIPFSRYAPDDDAKPFQVELVFKIEPTPVSEFANLDVKPTPLKFTHPTYPKKLLTLEIEGKVFIRFLIGADGKVIEARAIQYPHPDLAEAALEAVLESEWSPAQQDGKPVPCIALLPISFQAR